MQQLSPTDASFVYLETPKAPMHIGSLAIYDPSTAPNGRLRFKDVLAFFESRLDGARAFRQRLARVPLDLDHPWWFEDPEFDLEYHVRHIALPEPGDWRQLCILAARLHARPLDMSKPLWEFTIIEGLDNIEGIPKGCIAMLSKVHHAAVDGASGVEITTAIHDLAADAPPRSFDMDWKPERVPGAPELLARAQFNAVTQPLRQLDVLARSVPGVSKAAIGLLTRDLKLPSKGTAPRTIFNRPVSAHRVFDGAMFDLAEIKAIRGLVEGSTVNDVMLTVVGGGLRRYLQSHDALPDKDLIVMAPISVRTEEEKGSFGNQVSAMLVDLGTTIADPVERFRHVHQKTQASKELTGAVGARTLSNMSELMPGGLLGVGARLYARAGLARAHAPVFNCTVTNVPGPPVPLFFAGARMVAQWGTILVTDGQRLANVVYSYDGKVTLSFTADRDAMPDPEAYAAALRESFEELKAAAAPKTAPAARKVRAPAKPRPAAAAKPAAAPARKPRTRKPSAG